MVRSSPGPKTRVVRKRMLPAPSRSTVKSLALRALPPGIAGVLEHPPARRQQDHRLDAVAGKLPVGTGDVPVQLVVVVEIADLAAGLVGQRIGVFALPQEDAGLADIDHLAVGRRFDVVGLGLAVAQNLDHIEGHPHGAAPAVRIKGGEGTEDAALDVAPLGLHPQGLGHRQRGIGVDDDAALIVEDGLPRRRRGEDGKGQKTGQRRRQDTADHVPLPAPKETLGTARSAGSSSSKNSACWKPKRDATRFDGKDSTAMFMLRTAPL